MSVSVGLNLQPQTQHVVDCLGSSGILKHQEELDFQGPDAAVHFRCVQDSHDCMHSAFIDGVPVSFACKEGSIVRIVTEHEALTSRGFCLLAHDI
mgnify:CR=1 FL=1